MSAYNKSKSKVANEALSCNHQNLDSVRDHCKKVISSLANGLFVTDIKKQIKAGAFLALGSVMLSGDSSSAETNKMITSQNGQRPIENYYDYPANQPDISSLLPVTGDAIEEVTDLSLLAPTVEITSNYGNLSDISDLLDSHLRYLDQVYKKWDSRHSGYILRFLRFDQYMEWLGFDNQVTIHKNTLEAKLSELRSIREGLQKLQDNDGDYNELLINFENNNELITDDSINIFLKSKYGEYFRQSVHQADQEKLSSDSLDDKEIMAEFGTDLFVDFAEILPATELINFERQLMALLKEQNFTSKAEAQAYLKIQKQKLQEIRHEYDSLADKLGEIIGDTMTMDWAFGFLRIYLLVLISQSLGGRKKLEHSIQFARTTGISKLAEHINSILEWTPEMLKVNKEHNNLVNAAKINADFVFRLVRVAAPLYVFTSLSHAAILEYPTLSSLLIGMRESYLVLIINCPIGKAFGKIYDKSKMTNGGELGEMSYKELNHEIMNVAQRMPVETEKSKKIDYINMPDLDPDESRVRLPDGSMIDFTKLKN